MDNREAMDMDREAEATRKRFEFGERIIPGSLFLADRVPAKIVEAIRPARGDA